MCLYRITPADYSNEVPVGAFHVLYVSVYLHVCVFFPSFFCFCNSLRRFGDKD